MLENSPIVQSIRQNWDNLSSRDQLALKLLSIFVTAFIFYALVFLPSDKLKEQSLIRLDKATETFALIEQNKQLLLDLHRQGANTDHTSLEGNALISAITSSSKQNRLSLKRVEPTSEGRVRVWLEDHEYKNLARWIQDLNQRFRVKVADIRIEKTDKKEGFVSAKITFSS